MHTLKTKKTEMSFTQAMLFRDNFVNGYYDFLFMHHQVKNDPISLKSYFQKLSEIETYIHAKSINLLV